MFFVKMDMVFRSFLPIFYENYFDGISYHGRSYRGISNHGMKYHRKHFVKIVKNDKSNSHFSFSQKKNSMVFHTIKKWESGQFLYLKSWIFYDIIRDHHPLPSIYYFWSLMHGLRILSWENGPSLDIWWVNIRFLDFSKYFLWIFSQGLLSPPPNNKGTIIKKKEGKNMKNKKSIKLTRNLIFSTFKTWTNGKTILGLIALTSEPAV